MTLTIAVRPTSLALIDDADAEIIAPWRWYLDRKGYARGFRWCGGQTVTVYMHRLILGLTERADEVDHRNRDRLDNRRANLRRANRSLNNANRGTTAASGFRGVRFEPRLEKWRAFITAGGRSFALGTFATPELAARAYDAAAVKHFGDFATLNFPPPAPAVDVAASAELLEAL